MMARLRRVAARMALPKSVSISLSFSVEIMQNQPHFLTTATQKTSEMNAQHYCLHVESRALIGPDLDTGLLVEACRVDREGLGYHLVTRPGPVKPALRSLVRWLRSAGNN